METNSVGNFWKRIWGTGAKETIDAIGTAIDRIDKSDEKLELQLRYKELLLNIQHTFVEYESKLVENQSLIIQSETKGESFLQRNWRPILMLICTYIVLNNYVLVPYFRLPSAVLDDNIWDLIKMGVTGYVAGRSLEKISDNLGGVLQNVKGKRK